MGRRYSAEEIDRISDWADNIASERVPLKLAIAMWEIRQDSPRKLRVADQEPEARRRIAQERVVANDLYGAREGNVVPLGRRA